MVEVVHTYHGFYPFGQKKESDQTFMQLIKEGLSEEQISLFRQMSKIYKGINSPHFHKLIKMLREDQRLLFIYQYQNTSLQTYIEEYSKNLNTSLSKQKYKSIVIDFKTNIDNIIDVLIKQQIKTDILMANMAFTPQGDSTSLSTKVFIDMDSEYLSLIHHHYKPKDSKKKDRSGINQDFLFEFYDAERKRLMVDFEELLQKHFGNMNQASERKHFPNFVINGTKLVFQSTHDRSKDSSGEIKPETLDLLPDNKEVQGKSQEDKVEVQEAQTVIKKQELSKPSQKQTKVMMKKTHPQTPIVDFDQSFQPEFKPEEFTKQKTYIYEENDYLQSLEEELTKIAEKTSNSNNSRQIKAEQEKDGQRFEKKQLRQKDLTTSQGSIKSNSNNGSKDNLTNNDSYERNVKQGNIEARVDGKLNKYKMKIITSHQIEIEGGAQQPNVEQIEKQIIEGIRTGKISIKELAQNNPSVIVTNREQAQMAQRKNSDPQRMQYSDHKQEQKEVLDKMVASEKLNKETNCSKDMFVKKEIPVSKMKTVNQIIQKLGLKNHHKPATTQKQQVTEQGQKNQERKSLFNNLPPINKPSQLPAVSPSPPLQVAPRSTGPKLDKNQQIDKGIIKGLQKGEKVLGPQKDESEKVQLEKVEHEKTQNYMNKIKEAKSKAEQLLKEYNKKKH